MQMKRPTIKISKENNKLDAEDRAFHDWYRFVLSFPPRLVRSYLSDFALKEDQTVLDPFCGTGTTIVEAKLNHFRAIGLEANPIAHFASSIKVNWQVDPEKLEKHAHKAAQSARDILQKQHINDDEPFRGVFEDIWRMTLDQESMNLLLTNSISPMPLHKTLVLLHSLRDYKDEQHYGHLLLALASAVVFRISNLHFGPEVGVKNAKRDVPVITPWIQQVEKMAGDLRLVSHKAYPDSKVYLSDARKISDIIEPHSVDAVITSPPYPNEKDYTRTTRLESVLLGFIKNKLELRELKKNLLRSNTRGVYKGDTDDMWVAGQESIQQIAESIEKRRLELGKNSGFEKLYGKVTKLYFGGMARHFSELRNALRPGALLAYVVGDQASYLRIMIRTGALLAEIAQPFGYKVQRVDTFRTRFATATRSYLNEEVVILRWDG